MSAFSRKPSIYVPYTIANLQTAPPNARCGASRQTISYLSQGGETGDMFPTLGVAPLKARWGFWADLWGKAQRGQPTGELIQGPGLHRR